jgi:hypothetical protein
MKLFIILFFCFSSILLFSQNNTEIRISIYNTYVAPTYSDLPSIKPGFISEISFGEKLNGEQYWHYYYNFPTFYFSCFAGYPGSLEYGYIVGLSPQFSFDKRLINNWNYHIKTGIGIAYHTNVYDRKYNPNNMLIGSNLTAMANIEIGLSYKFQVHNYIGISVSVLHFSNGHCKLPNIGMNLPAVNCFYKYSFSDLTNEVDYSNRNIVDHKWDFFVSAAIGMHEFGTSTKPANGPNYGVYDLNFGLTKKTSPIHKFSLGLNFLHYNSFEKFIIFQELNIGNPFIKSSAFGVFGAHEFLFGKFALYTELGLDIYKPFYRYMITMYGDKYTVKDVLKSINSNKLGLRYYFTKSDSFGLVGGINLKVNMAQADFIEIFCSFEF